MRIWVDADACPGPVRDILLRASQRLNISTVFVANKRLTLPRSELVSTVQVGAGLDVADRHIAEQAQRGDLAVTQDIPLAALLVPRGVVVLDPRGDLFTEENISERLSVRNFMQELRESGVTTSGPSGFSPKDGQRFANALDRELTRLLAARK
ncbi:YaiI/YqxD family protein [Pyxidicoccus sp. 3LG]